MKVSDLDKNRKYLLACSYGPDSMALFHLLEKNAVSFEVAHVNYNLRKESGREMRKLAKYCKAHNKTFHCLEVNKKIRGNIESKCREIRYNFFRSIYDNFSYEAVLVAHNEDDLLETYILQKRRRNCPKYYGIAEQTYINWMRVYRPLLGYTKEELLNICKENNVPFAIDKSNLKDQYQRNQIRHHIIAKMSREDRDKMLEDIKNANATLVKMFDSIDYSKIGDIEYLLTLDDTTYKYTINRLAEDALYNPEISARQCHEIKKILLSDKPNVVTHMKGELFFIKEYDKCRFVNGTPTKEGYSYLLKEPSKLDTDYFYLDFSIDASNRKVRKGDYPLTIRNAQKEDEVRINDYTVRVKRLFIDWKMPISIRSYWPVIVNKKGQIVYIPRYQKDFVVPEGCNFYVKIK